MYARHVTMKLTANSAPEFTRTIDSEILPLLSKQKGFRDCVTFIASERSEALAISLWDTKEDAETYNRTAYPHVLKALSKVVERTPQAETFEVTNSTFHKVVAKAASSR